MKTTRIEIDLTTYSPDFQTRRLVVNWKRDGVLHTVESSMLEDTAPPEKVALILRELAHKIDKTCRGLPPTPELEFKSHCAPENWKQFVEDVSRMDRRLNDGSLPLRYDPRRDDLTGTAPLFEFMGFKVFRR